MIEIIMSGKAYHNIKSKFKEILKINGFKWVGSLESPRWNNEVGDITAEFLRENNYTKQTTIRADLTDANMEEVLTKVLVEAGGELTQSERDEPPSESVQEGAIELPAYEYLVFMFMRSRGLYSIRTEGEWNRWNRIKMEMDCTVNLMRCAPDLSRRLVQDAIEHGILIADGEDVKFNLDTKDAKYSNGVTSTEIRKLTFEAMKEIDARMDREREEREKEYVLNNPNVEAKTVVPQLSVDPSRFVQAQKKQLEKKEKTKQVKLEL
jgi:hypothetical protein